MVCRDKRDSSRAGILGPGSGMEELVSILRNSSLEGAGNDIVIVTPFNESVVQLMNLSLEFIVIGANPFIT